MRQIKAIIKNESEQWTEEFSVPEGQDAVKFIKQLVKNFNGTLRDGERMRVFYKAYKKGFPVIKSALIKNTHIKY